MVFTRRADAMAAVERYNNVQLDGKPMKIEIVGANIITPAPVVIPAANGLYGNENFGARRFATKCFLSTCCSYIKFQTCSC